MSTITKKDIEHIARLARLELSATEEAKMTEQLGGILDYVAKLSEVDTNGVEPTAQVTGLENVYRPDEVGEDHKPGANTETLLSQVPDREGDYVKVKGIFSAKGGSASGGN